MPLKKGKKAKRSVKDGHNLSTHGDGRGQEHASQDSQISYSELDVAKLIQQMSDAVSDTCFVVAWFRRWGYTVEDAWSYAFQGQSGGAPFSNISVSKTIYVLTHDTLSMDDHQITPDPPSSFGEASM